jgi:hypothetical protein
LLCFLQYFRWHKKKQKLFLIIFSLFFIMTGQCGLKNYVRRFFLFLYYLFFFIIINGVDDSGLG